MAVSSVSIQREVANASASGWMPYFEASSRRHGVPVGLLLAVASQETRIGTGGLIGDGGHARGLMQINDRFHAAFVRSHRDDDHRANIDYGASILADEKRRRGSWRDALTAYNSGSACWSSGRASACRKGRAYADEVFDRWNAIKDRAMEPNELPEPRSPLWEATVGPVWDRTLGPVVTGIYDFGAGLFDPGSGFTSQFEALNRRFADLVENPAPLPGSGAARYLFPLGLLLVAIVVGRKVLTKKK